ncbi:hypothetical protein ACLGI4_28465 [Streptomyces sp. HMX112]
MSVPGCCPGRPRQGLAVGETEPDRLLDLAVGCDGTDVEFAPAP